MINTLTGGIDFIKEKEYDDFDEDHKEENLLDKDINRYYNPVPSTLSLDERLELIKSVGEEILMEDEIIGLLKRKQMPICYDGFEPSGRMHIAQGVMRMINVNKLTKAGCEFTFWVADWFALMNNKMGGDINKIRTVGKYLVEIWKAVGMNLKNVKFLWASDEINRNPHEYWSRVIDIACKNNLDRITRCSQIMGREDGASLKASQIMYPCMQCADIFFLKADICQLGKDQRKVNVLAREYCDDIQQKNKPIIISHHMLSGLKKDQAKMSKSDPSSAIFMEDSEKDVIKKINTAFCEEKMVIDNPVLDYCKSIIFAYFGYFDIIRPEKFGGNIHFTEYEQLEKAYANGDIHPGDLKPSVAAAINKLLQPVREHFETDPEAKKLLQLVKSFQVTK